MNPQVVYVQTVPAPGSRTRPNYASKAGLVLAGIQLSIGILCVFLDTVAICLYPFRSNIAGTGIFCGIFFIITGGLGIGAARTKTNCLIIGYMVMSIISAILTLGMFLGSGNAVVEGYYGNHYGVDHSLIPSFPFPYTNAKISMGINATLLILVFVELIIAIVASALCCNGLCGCCKGPPGGDQVMLMPNMYQQTIPYGQLDGTSDNAIQPNMVQVNIDQPAQPHDVMAASQDNTNRGNSPPPSYSEELPKKE